MKNVEVEANGGFPEPPAGTPVCEVFVRHPACGDTTRVRIPAELPLHVVRIVVCRSCGELFHGTPFEAEDASLDEGLGVQHPFPRFTQTPARAAEADVAPTPSKPAPRLPRFDPHGRFWRLASFPLAGAAVVVVLMLVQGSDDHSALPAASTASGAAASTDGGPGKEPSPRGEPAGRNARLVRESTFSLALPPHWQRFAPQAGATFYAEAPQGEADATVWVVRKPELDFPTFEAQSLSRLRDLAGSAKVIDRVAAPTADGTIVRLAAAAPANSPQYEVTLRVSGPYRYYLATTLQPDASPETADAVDLIHGSFVPPGGK